MAYIHDLMMFASDATYCKANPSLAISLADSVMYSHSIAWHPDHATRPQNELTQHTVLQAQLHVPEDATKYPYLIGSATTTPRTFLLVLTYKNTYRVLQPD
jgi:hypothetical protein